MFWDANRQATPTQIMPSVNQVLLLLLGSSGGAATAARLGALLRLKEEAGLCDIKGEDGIFPFMRKGVAVAPGREVGGGEGAVMAAEEEAAVWVAEVEEVEEDKDAAPPAGGGMAAGTAVCVRVGMSVSVLDPLCANRLGRERSAAANDDDGGEGEWVFTVPCAVLAALSPTPPYRPASELPASSSSSTLLCCV